MSSNCHEADGQRGHAGETPSDSPEVSSALKDEEEVTPVYSNPSSLPNSPPPFYSQGEARSLREEPRDQSVPGLGSHERSRRSAGHRSCGRSIAASK